jgi:hypothetical protein
MSETPGRDGLYFRRELDGSVTVRTIRETTFTADEWAAIVASVSARGSTGSTWTEASDYHLRED